MLPAVAQAAIAQAQFETIHPFVDGKGRPGRALVDLIVGIVLVLSPPLDEIAFVAQGAPLYKNLSAADLLHETRNLNRRFDQDYAEHRLGELGVPLDRKAGKMSGGQQARLALTLAARRPRLLLSDEPMAMLDPITRHDFMATVMTRGRGRWRVGPALLPRAVGLERVADYLVLVSHGSVQVAGEVEDLLATHCMLTRASATPDLAIECRPNNGNTVDRPRRLLASPSSSRRPFS